MKTSIPALAILGTFGISCLAQAAVFQVAPNGGPDCVTGICQLQAALDEAASNGEDNVILLAAGNYSPGQSIYHYQPLQETGTLTLEGDSGGGTILIGGGDRVMYLDTTAAPSDAGSSIFINHVTFRAGESSDVGSGLGVRTIDAGIYIDRCQFLSNLDRFGTNGGGGLAVNTIGTGSIELTNSQLRENATANTGGGALLVSNGSGNVTVKGNHFENNSALNSVVGTSGGFFALSLSGALIIENNLILNNRAFRTGGGAIIQPLNGVGTIRNNIVSGNKIASDGSDPINNVAAGIDVITLLGTLNIVQNTITENIITDGDGGGMAIFLADASAVANVFNNIVFGNTAGGGFYCTTSCNDLLVIDNGEFGSGAMFSLVGAQVNIFNNDFSDIFFNCNPNKGCVPHRSLGSNLNLEPLLTDPFQGDFHLRADSPLINQGDLFAPTLPDFDFEGSPRVQGGRPDLGALEFPLDDAIENCFNNVDDDGDGKIDCLDTDCSNSEDCEEPLPPGVENCANNMDDDGDGQIDCNDLNCSGAAACLDAHSDSLENCTNNIDDDGDGKIDCKDSDCAAACQNDDSQSPANVSVSSGCAMVEGGGSPLSLVFLSLPMLTVLMRWRRCHGSA